MDATTAPPLKGQDAAHPDGQYSTIAKWFHWLTLPPMIIVILSGITIRFVKDDVKFPYYSLHESLGVILFVLALARLSWRLVNKPPATPAHMPARMHTVAAGVHHALYALLILQPLLGFFTANAYGFPMSGPTAFLGFIDQPKFMEASETLAFILHWMHSLAGWALCALIVAHVGGAVYHHALRRDGTLMRML